MRPSTPPTTPAAPDPDPFRYGWRYVKRALPDGSTELEEVPLTLEDVLHPEEEDVIPVRTLHQMDCAYLADVFRSRPLPGPPHAFVTADLRIDWGVEGLRAHSPDLAVFVGMRQELDPEKGTLYLAQSGGRCLLALEVVSPDTRSNDVVHKVGHYHTAGVPLYAIVDQEREHEPRRLVAYRWEEGGYAPAELDSRGRLPLPFLGLLLEVRDDRVVCYDSAAGKELGDYARVAQQLEEADRRIQEQEQALEESVEQLKRTSRARDEAQQAREKAEKARDEERQAREKAEKRVQELEELLRRPQQGDTHPPPA